MELKWLQKAFKCEENCEAHFVRLFTAIVFCLVLNKCVLNIKKSLSL